MHANSSFERFMRKVGMLPSGETYQIYIPEVNRILGYFKNKDMDFSDAKFYDFVKGELQNELDNKVKKNKFILKIEINNNTLDCLASSERNLNLAKKRVEEEYKNVQNFLKK